MIGLLKTIPNVSITLTTFDYPNTIVASDVADISDVAWLDNWQDFVDDPHESGDLYLITGSLYFMSQVRSYLNDNKKITK